jgi:hypothetical protein
MKRPLKGHNRVAEIFSLLAYCVEKLDVEVGDSATLSSKLGLHSG